MRHDLTEADALIVGSGIMGAAVARLLREQDPKCRIIMIDGGPALGPVAGQHLHDSLDPAVGTRYHERTSSGIQSMYLGADLAPEVSVPLDELPPGMYNLSAIGEDATAMPASAAAWNIGGMGVHWTAATPWPAGAERFDADDTDWDADLATARRILNVHPSPIGPTEPGRKVLEVLEREYGGSSPEDRHPQPMPMAVQPTTAGPQPRTSPSSIFPPIATGADPAFVLLADTLAVAIDYQHGRARGARVRDVRSGHEYVIEAAASIICADTMRTPQLLYASGIRPAALGRYLNEHAFITSRVLVDLDRLDLNLQSLPRPRSGEFCTDSLWLPQNGPRQPFHGQIMNTVYTDDDDRALAYSVGISLYTPVESRPENRLVFSETETDITGLPMMTIEFAYSARDLDLIRRAQQETLRLARLFGEIDPASETALLPPGSSLHQTGTVRMGTADDGTSVCDPDGRVWGFDNLYLAGNGVVPTPVVCNATLTGTITAARSARAVAQQMTFRARR